MTVPSNYDPNNSRDQRKEKLEVGIGHAWKIIRETLELYTIEDCAIRAAGVAYHLLLSIFPLLLFLVFLSSEILETSDVRQRLSSYLTATIPAIASDVERVLDETIQARGSFGLIGAVLLVWSASTLFMSVSRTLNVIWGAEHRPILRRRAVGILTVLVVCILFIASVWLSAFTVWPLSNLNTTIGYWIQFAVDPGLIILFLWLIFRVLPNRFIHPRPALAGAVLSGVLWRLARSAFALFLSSDLANYGLIYGSLASVVILMLWAYFSGAILFLGASFGSVLEKHYWNIKSSGNT
jgi:membrane protein